MRKPLIFTAAAALLGSTMIQVGPAQSLPGNPSGLRDAAPAHSELIQPVDDEGAALGIGIGLGLLGGALLTNRYHDHYRPYGYHSRGYYYRDDYYDPPRAYYGPPRGYYYEDYGRADDSGHPNRRTR